MIQTSPCHLDNFHADNRRLKIRKAIAEKRSIV